MRSFYFLTLFHFLLLCLVFDTCSYARVSVLTTSPVLFPTLSLLSFLPVVCTPLCLPRFSRFLLSLLPPPSPFPRPTLFSSCSCCCARSRSCFSASRDTCQTKTSSSSRDTRRTTNSRSLSGRRCLIRSATSGTFHLVNSSTTRC